MGMKSTIKRRWPDWREFCEYLYVMQVQVGEHSWMKVGISNDPERRIISVQGGCPIPILDVWCVRFKTRTYAELAEAQIHGKLAESFSCGEWFSGSATPETMAMLLETCPEGRAGSKWAHIDFRDKHEARGRADRTKVAVIERRRATAIQQAEEKPAHLRFNITDVPLDELRSIYRK